MEYVFSEPLIVLWAGKEWLSYYAGVEEGKIKVIFIELLRTKTYNHAKYTYKVDHPSKLEYNLYDNSECKRLYEPGTSAKNYKGGIVTVLSWTKDGYEVKYPNQSTKIIKKLTEYVSDQQDTDDLTELFQNTKISDSQVNDEPMYQPIDMRPDESVVNITNTEFYGKSAFKKILENSKIDTHLPGLHLIALRTQHLLPKPNTKTYTFSEKEDEQIELLERMLDWHDIRARVMDNEAFFYKNSLKNIKCHTKGVLEDSDDLKRLMQEDKNDIISQMTDDWVNFPMIEMDNVYSFQFKEDKCEGTEGVFSAYAGHYDLNNVTFNFEVFKSMFDAEYTLSENDKENTTNITKIIDKMMEKLTKSNSIAIKPKAYVYHKRKYARVIEKDREEGEEVYWKIKYMDKTGEAIVTETELHPLKRHWCKDQWEYNRKHIKTSFLRLLKQNKNTDQKETLKACVFKDKNDTIRCKRTPITSRYGNKQWTEYLYVDERLFNISNPSFDVPLMCIPSILREGANDFHTVYYEGVNALGRLNSWACVLLVRQNELEEYIKRYASEHTYFVALPDRIKDEGKPQRYSAGDSKYYCYRIADYLHNLWKSKTRRFIIMDDQLTVFEHQAAVNEGEITDIYKLRNQLKDAQKNPMKEFKRSSMTLGAALMYFERLSKITNAAVVSTRGQVINGPSIAKNKLEFSFWLFDLNICNRAFHIKSQYLQTPIHPAYNAAEDSFMATLMNDRGLRTVSCQTMRRRKPVTGGGTCGRQKIAKPYTPVIRYFNMYEDVRYNDKYLKDSSDSEAFVFTTKKTFMDFTKRLRKIEDTSNLAYPFENSKLVTYGMFLDKKVYKQAKLIEKKKELLQSTIADNCTKTQKWIIFAMSLTFQKESYYLLMPITKVVEMSGGMPLNPDHIYGSTHRLDMAMIHVVSKALKNKRNKDEMDEIIGNLGNIVIDAAFAQLKF